MSNSRNYYNALATSYQEVSKKRSNYLRAVDQSVADSISKINPKRLLDIGSGDGKRIFELTKKTNAEVWALENSSEMCSILSKSFPAARILEKDISELGEIPETFDTITALWNVLGHIELIEPIIYDIHERLSPCGVFIFDVNNPLNVSEYGILPSIRNWWKIHIRHELLAFNVKQGSTETDVYFRPVKSYKTIIKRAGFSKVRIKFINYSSGKQTHRFRGQIYFECTY